MLCLLNGHLYCCSRFEVYLFPTAKVGRIVLLNKALACVASVSSRGSSRKLGQEQKKWMTGEVEGNEGTKVSSSPLPLPLQPFFCFRSNFRAITRLEMLATQANKALSVILLLSRFEVYLFPTVKEKKALLHQKYTLSIPFKLY